MENKVLSEKAKDIVKRISECVENNQTIDSNNHLFQDDLKRVISDIERIKKEFESQMFFLVSAGAIKSGKSTLINLLAGRVVSTTKQGKETTLRPAIICKGDEDSILLFNTTRSISADEENSDLNDLAIDFIKGFIDEKTLNEKHSIKVSRKKFTEENISKYLTERHIEEEPKLVNIQIKTTNENKISLLEQNIAIIDTPGIDGILAGAEGLKGSEQKLDLMSRVDLMLFLQSSVTPINSESAQYINNLAKEHSITNISLVHNKFTLKPWRKELKLDKEEDADSRAVEQAKEHFKKYVKDLKTNILDFAKAEDGYKFQHIELIKESKFDEFQTDLFENIKVNRRELQEKRVFNSLKELIIKNLSKDEGITLQTIKSRIKAIEEKWRKEEDELISKLTLIQDFFTNNKKILNLINIPMNEDIQTEDDGWELEKTILEINNYIYPKYEIEISKGDKKARILDEITKKIKAINDDVYKKLNSLDKFNKFISESKHGENTIRELVNQFNNIRNDIQIDEFKLRFNVEEHCKRIDISPTKIYDDVKSIWNKLVFKNLDEKQIEKIKTTVKEDIKKDLIEMVDKFKDKLHESIKKEFSDYVAKLESEKSVVRDILKNKRKDEEEKLEKTKETVQELKDFFDDLKHQITNH